MLFNSPVYIFLFLPLVTLIYFLLTHSRLITLSRFWLILSSLFFYAYWNPKYLVLIFVTLIVNYYCGICLKKYKNMPDLRKLILISGIIFDIGLLAYYKYANFFIDNINALTNANFTLLNLVLPLGISFFTFQKIAFLVDCYRYDMKQYSFIDYSLFVTFFPQLIAGPIVHHKDVIPQFSASQNHMLNWDNIAKGLFIFCIGLFKKNVVADFFAVWANTGYSSISTLDFWSTWSTTLSYTLQIYYDFSAYSDMAIGAALLFNIHLPLNFNSPYQSLNIQDFWRRWHISLSTFLREYVYIPLGGNRKGEFRAYINLIITFLLGGFWHGASWTFLVWGLMHGVALSIHRAWQKSQYKLPKLISWLLTFIFINCTWIYFRADKLSDANILMKKLVAVEGFNWNYLMQNLLSTSATWLGNDLNQLKLLCYLIIFSSVCFFFPNSIKISRYSTTLKETSSIQLKTSYIFFIGSVLFYSLVCGIRAVDSQFLYFNF